MIEFDDVIEAKESPEKLSSIYSQIFFDGRKPKLKMWLVKKGVPFNEIDEVYSKMNMSFLMNVKKYNHPKIHFEKFIWTCFNQELLNHFASKKLKKNSCSVGIDDCVGSAKTGYDYEFNIGYIPSNFEIRDSELEGIFMRLTQQQALICRMIYYSDFTKKEICEYLGISRLAYDNEMKVIKTVFEKHYDR